VTTVLLIRHGRTNANATGTLAGRSPGVELDEVGLRQASDTAERLKQIPLQAVITSPLRRCRQTARCVFDGRTDPTGLQLPIVTDSGLTECGYGTWTGKTLKELAKEPLWRTVQQQPSAVRFPDGESLTEMSARAVAAIRRWDAKVRAEHGDDACWAATSHGDVIKAVLADALGMHLDSFQRIMVDPASISVIRYSDGRPSVLRMNSVSSDLQALLPKPKKAGRGGRRRKRPSQDAAVGGGLGAADE
jgi:2,3-bisphosphoglycerate-dependent phosphoglycerate mutase